MFEITHPFSHQTKTPVLVCQPFFLCKKSKVGSIFPNLPKIILLKFKGAKAVRVFEGWWTQDLPSIYHRIYNFFFPKFKIVGIKSTRNPTHLWSTSTEFVPYTSQQKQTQTRNSLQTSFLKKTVEKNNIRQVTKPILKKNTHIKNVDFHG